MNNMKINNEKMNTLNDTIDELNQRIYELVEITGLSNKLLSKFLNPKGELTSMSKIGPLEPEKHGTIVDEFANISERIGSNTHIINDNLIKVLKMID